MANQTIFAGCFDFVQFISEQRYIYLDTNMSDYIFASTLWEALTAFLSGQIITRNAHIRKINRKKIEDLSPTNWSRSVSRHPSREADIQVL